MNGADILKVATLFYVIAVGYWFATAQARFSRASKARPSLFLMVGCSLVAMIATVATTLNATVPWPRLLITIVTTSVCLALIKMSFRAINQKNLGLVFSGVVPDALVQHGPYRFVRHPLYLSYSIFWVGCVVLSGSWLVAAAAALIFVLYVLAARGEERDLLSSEFGADYAEYAKRTGLIIPRFRTGA